MVLPENVFSTATVIPYKWGADCLGWNFIQQPGAAVKQERMPPGTSEILHYHEFAQQFFFILAGTAVFEVDGIETIVGKQQGFSVLPGAKHKITNPVKEELEFILFSFPSADGDRIECGEPL
ncbi:cupin domain-containing protein [Hufsiella ginkgonis]|uniref:Cupin domain-containing protein n=1 Tax=Hufsiella ginkgonis TaxID=2695274 RepID=A0A7K1XTU2_9SPHI|nr:cupin domain-containing protein [Hufsiella ginkgonis]MXV14394.1 cupin domain-containing protein [Hufsiella ginkgonis]